jgi:hypothetical protein
MIGGVWPGEAEACGVKPPPGTVQILAKKAPNADEDGCTQSTQIARDYKPLATRLRLSRSPMGPFYLAARSASLSPVASS